MTSTVRIKKGSVLIYRLFDVAEEINVRIAEANLRDSRGPDRFQVPKFIDRAIIMKSPPVSFALGTENLKIKGRDLKADVQVKIRDFGTISLIYQIQIEPGMTWEDLVHLASDLEDEPMIDATAIRQAKEVTTAIAPALKRPTEWKAFEDYIIYFIEELDANCAVKDLIHHADVASLLVSEDKVKLSDSTRKSVTENIYQYGENDLTMIEWNSALVIEPGGGREVADILEFALTHLMEMRYYDDLLDDRLNSLYDEIEKRRANVWHSGFRQLSEEASQRYIEFSEFIERVENSLKVVGDFYLATVYRAATRRFRLADWQQNITRKMGLLAQVSSLLQGEVNVSRSFILEIVVIVLIAYEVFIALFKH